MAYSVNGPAQGTPTSRFSSTSKIHEYNADLIIMITRNPENSLDTTKYVHIAKDRSGASLGMLNPEVHGADEFRMLMGLFLEKKNDPAYKELYDKLLFTYAMKEKI